MLQVACLCQRVRQLRMVLTLIPYPAPVLLKGQITTMLHEQLAGVVQQHQEATLSIQQKHS
jgi:hypothetical protein